MLRRLEDRGLRCMIMLIGRCTPPPMGGEAGGEAMVADSGEAVRLVGFVRSRVAGPALQIEY
jgi:hypothetical protein